MAKKISPYDTRNCLCCGKVFMPKHINHWCIDKSHRNRYDYEQLKEDLVEQRMLNRTIKSNEQILKKFHLGIPGEYMDIPAYAMRALGFDDEEYFGRSDNRRGTFKYEYEVIKKNNIEYIRIWK